jgi:hypothetical protein
VKKLFSSKRDLLEIVDHVLGEQISLGGYRLLCRRNLKAAVNPEIWLLARI